MEGLGISLGYLLVQLINFAIMFVVLNAWVVKPIMRMLNKRREVVAQGIEDARVAAEARANAERDAEKVLKEAQEKAGLMIKEAQERASVAAREITAAAEAETAKNREVALAELEEERNRMLTDLRGQIVTLSIAAAQKLIGENLDEKRQRVLLDEFFSGVKNGKVVVLEGEIPSTPSIDVISALPLTSAEQESIRKEVVSRMTKGNPKIEFRVDTAILGGLIIRAGDRVMDGSIAGQLEALRQNLK